MLMLDQIFLKYIYKMDFMIITQNVISIIHIIYNMLKYIIQNQMLVHKYMLKISNIHIHKD